MLHKFMLRLKRSSPTILTCMGAIGVVATAISAARAAPKAKQLMEEEDNIVQAIPAYIPTIVIASATISCIFGANILNRRQQASLMSAYALLDNYHKRYRGKLKEMYGEDTDEEIRTAMAREYCDYHQIGLDVPDGKVLFYDEISGESFIRYEREVMDAEYHLNRNFVLRGYASLNEFYEFLGLPQTNYGDILGWSISDGYYWIDFEHRLITQDDGGPDMYAIDVIFPPENDYMRDWE